MKSSISESKIATSKQEEIRERQEAENSKLIRDLITGVWVRIKL